MEGKKVDSKLLLFTLILVLITLFLLNGLFRGAKSVGIWNYDEITTGTQLIAYGTLSQDRQTYYIMEEIVNKYLNSYISTYGNEELEDWMPYEQYYDYLTDNYKDYLSRKDYEKLAKEFLNKFYVYEEGEYDATEFMDTYNVIKAIYELDNDVYLCELRGETTLNKGYIAIATDSNDNTYRIIYIE